jgi:centromere/kinetochore protein ZW10
MCLPDISVDESEQIPAILEPLTAGVRDAVLPPGSGAGSEELAAALAERTPAVMKLQELCELLDIRMVEIRQRWQEGRLEALGFRAAEVRHLVRALFEDTDLRRDFLHLLEAAAEQEEAAELL